MDGPTTFNIISVLLMDFLAQVQGPLVWIASILLYYGAARIMLRCTKPLLRLHVNPAHFQVRSLSVCFRRRNNHA